ncbi:MAG: calcium/proton exchanger [Candidatus Thermoplasmatota archaeon]
MRKIVRSPTGIAILILVPTSIILEVAQVNPTLVFMISAAAIIPLASVIGKATEELAKYSSAATGALLNATFGNVAELIIAIFAIKEGLIVVVQASITGSIIGNILIVLGLSMFVGGLKHKEQTFSRRTAGTSTTMLTLAAIALIMPALFFYAQQTGLLEAGFFRLELMCFLVSVILIITYIAGLIFSLHTHKHIFISEWRVKEAFVWSKRTAIVLLIISTALVAMESEFLVSAIQPMIGRIGISQTFVGVIIIAMVGNGAEHSSAIMFAYKNKMDLSVNIATSSSTQIALFVAPLLVFISAAMGTPMTLAFEIFEVVAIVLSIAIVLTVYSDGESNWFEGLQLVAVYAIFAVVFFYHP